MGPEQVQSILSLIAQTLRQLDKLAGSSKLRADSESQDTISAVHRNLVQIRRKVMYDKRLSASGPVSVQSPGTKLDGRLVDISLGGAKVDGLPCPLELGAPTSLLFAVGETKTQAIDAVIAWQIEDVAGFHFHQPHLPEVQRAVFEVMKASLSTSRESSAS